MGVTMKIKNKLILAFVLVAFIPVALVGGISVLNIRSEAVDQFLDGSTREIRQIDGNMRQFFDGTLQNVDQMAKDPVYTSVTSLKDYTGADAASQPMPEAAQRVIDAFARYGTTHPAAAILSIGLEDGSYAKWPDDPQLAKYDPRPRPWYKAATEQGATEVVIDGVRYMANVWTSPGLGWRFVGLIEYDEVMAAATRMTYVTAVIVVLLALIFAGVAAAFSRVIVKPIGQVSTGLQSIAEGEGDLRRDLQVQGKDETAELAGWFNKFLAAIRQLIQRIGAASTNLHEASRSNSEMAGNMNEAAGRQREAVELVSTAFNEMVATANEVARSCSSAADAAEQGHRRVAEGKQQIEATTDNVNRLGRRLSESSQAMVELEEGSRSINQILGTIRAIAEQTNLLALNAAIEAARAGDQGRGFAVVADEVRALAKRTADSTGEIDQLLNTLGGKTHEVPQKRESCLDLSRASVSSIENARDSFEGIQLSVNEIRDQNLQISAAAEEQHSVAEEINRHIQQIYDEARLVEGLASSAQADSGRLAQLSDELNGLVGRFKS